MFSQTRWTRAGGLVGIAFFVLMIARIILSPEAGNPEDATSVIAAKVAAHPTGVLVDAAVGNLAVLLLLVFAAALADGLRRAGAARELTGLVSGGAVAAAALAFVNHAAWAALAYERAALGDGATRVLFDLAQLADVAARFPIALLVGAASVAALQSRVLSRGVAVAGLGVAALNLAAGTATAQVGILALNGPLVVLSILGFMLWTAVTGGQLARRPRIVPADRRPEPALVGA